MLMLDYNAMLSRAAREQPKSTIRELFPLERRPGMISMLAGQPNPSGFPFASISASLHPVGTEAPVQLVVEGARLEEALRYTMSPGLDSLLSAYARTITHVHGRAIDDGSPAGDFALSCGNGSQDLLTKSFHVVLDPGDTVLTEVPLYTGVLPSLLAHKANLVGVGMDEQGLSVEALEKKLTKWHSDPSTAHLPFPKILYTVPSGSNPSGTTASAERKRAVLALVRRFGILLFEDDPYYYITFDGLGGDPTTRPRVPSYFALERESGEYGYVLRFESLSKIISSGLRLGFMYGPRTIVQAATIVTSTTNLHPSGVAQALTATLLEHWGLDGFFQHVDRVAYMYKERSEMFGSFVEKHLGGAQPVAQWTRPVAGMFFWLKLHLPRTDAAPEGDSFDLMVTKAVNHNVLLVPGSGFFPDGARGPYVRASFSQIEPADADEGLRRLRDVIEDAWRSAGFDSIPPL